jgi:hypothetical protein
MPADRSTPGNGGPAYGQLTPQARPLLARRSAIGHNPNSYVLYKT